MSDFRVVAGWLAGCFFLLGFVPYLAAIFRGETVPSRTSWFIWAVLGVLIAGSYRSSGAENTLFGAFAGAIGPVVIAFVSVRKGEGGVSKSDLVCFSLAAAGITAWWFTDSPFFGLLLFLATDFFGLIPTLVKTWKEPGSENVTAWMCWFIGNSFNLYALESWRIQISAYVIYFWTMAFVMIVLILLPRRSNIL